MIFRMEFNCFRIGFVVYVFTSLNTFNVSAVSTPVFFLSSYLPLSKKFYIYYLLLNRFV